MQRNPRPRRRRFSQTSSGILTGSAGLNANQSGTFMTVCPNDPQPRSTAGNAHHLTAFYYNCYYGEKSCRFPPNKRRANGEEPSSRRRPRRQQTSTRERSRASQPAPPPSDPRLESPPERRCELKGFPSRGLGTPRRRFGVPTSRAGACPGRAPARFPAGSCLH